MITIQSSGAQRLFDHPVYTYETMGCTYNTVEHAFYVTEGTVVIESTTEEIYADVEIKYTTLLMSSIKNVI
jgi:hypothetical protein